MGRLFGAAACSGLVLMLACATRGRSFNEDAVALITSGVTTRARVQELFGRPTSIRVRGSGGSEWRYVHEETRTEDTGTLRKIGRSIGSVLGTRTYLPPVDVRYSNTVRRELSIQFDSSGRVVDYTYEVKENPTRRIY